MLICEYFILLTGNEIVKFWNNANFCNVIYVVLY